MTLHDRLKQLERRREGGRRWSEVWRQDWGDPDSFINTNGEHGRLTADEVRARGGRVLMIYYDDERTGEGGDESH